MDGTLPGWLEMLLTVLLEWETLAVESLHAIFDQIGWAGVSGLVVLETSTGIGSSEVILGLSGWLLLAEHKLPVSTVFSGGLYAAAASLVGASIQYWAARLGGRPLLMRYGRWVMITPDKIKGAERWATTSCTSRPDRVVHCRRMGIGVSTSRRWRHAPTQWPAPSIPCS